MQSTVGVAAHPMFSTRAMSCSSRSSLPGRHLRRHHRALRHSPLL